MDGWIIILTRIFVYHAEANHVSKDVFKTMERKLYNYIMMPAMLLSWLFGVLLIQFRVCSFCRIVDADKNVAVVILTYYHFLLGKYLNEFAINDNKKSSKFYRIINEVPTIILIVVVFVVVF